jgi:DNA-binding CsgD family transcriptional regulator
VNSVVVGREHEIAEANGFLAEAAQRPCGLLLVGEAGIGKTTIWSAVVEEATERGFEVLAARPSEAEGELAFAVLTDLFARLDGDALAELPDVQRAALEHALRRADSQTTVDPTAVALAVLGTFRSLAASSPVVVAVDDLQWVDPPSLRVLTFAFRRLEGASVGLVATVRTGFDLELTRLAERDGNGIDRIEIGGLAKRHLAQLVFERTGRILTPPQLARLAELSGGSPYYALELASTGDPELPVPKSLAVALRARLASLSPVARAAGLAAATLGRFDRVVTDGPHRSGLEELRSAGVVDVRSGQLWFAHPLLASTLVELHTLEERRAAHLALANALDDADERALHLGRGTEAPSEEVAAELEAAATRLDRRGAPETAAILAERAAALTPDDESLAKTRRLIKTADLYQAAGEAGDHVVPLLEQLVETLEPGPDRARAVLRLGWLGAQQDTISGSDAVAYQRRALAEAGGASDVVAAANAALARMLGNTGDYRAAREHAELAVAAGAVTEANLMFPSPFGELAIASLMTGDGLDEHLFDQGIELESRLGRVGEPYQSAKLQLALALLYTGQLARARTLLRGLLQLSVELGRVRSAAGCVLHLVELEVCAGRLSIADDHARQFVDLDRQLRGDMSGEWYPSGLVAVHLGRIEDARRILSAAIEYTKSVEAWTWHARQLWALGHLELAIGNLAAAKDALAPLPGILRARGLGEWAAYPVHPDAIEVLVELGEADEAVALQTELEQYGRRLDRPWGLATAARSAALIASARGSIDEALDATDRALAEHERLDWPLERARTLLVRGTVLRRLGRRLDASAALGEAKAVFGALRNPLWFARADAEERRLGSRRAASDALTPTEERVAELAAEGLRNAEIAARLFVTPKTVEAALSRVYRKLGIRSRTELARRSASGAKDADPAGV